MPDGLDRGRLLDAYVAGWADGAPLAHLHAAAFYARTLLPYYLGRAAAAAP